MQKTTHTPVANFRIPKELREAARATAAARGETLTQAVIAGLQWYVKKYGQKM